MRIGIISSMHHTEKMLEAQAELRRLGHEPYLCGFADTFVGKTDEEKEALKIDQKLNQDAIREFWHKMQGGDAVLVLNLERHGIPNYVGGNTLMEIGFAHVLGQKVFMYNPVPDMPYCKSEIEAVKPVILHGNLAAIC